MQNRDYQTKQIEDAIELVSTKRKICVQLPTGGGKTVEFANLAQRYIRNTDNSVLILVHREELMYQAQRTIKLVCGIESILITSSSKHYRIARVYIGMIESLVSRLDLFDNVGLVIIDECHIANFNKVHNIFLEELIIGYSATPISSNKRMPLNKFYSDIVIGPQIRELILSGFLAQNITRSPKDVVDATKFEVDKLKGDYNEKQMSTEYRLPKHVTNVVRNYRRFCKGTKTIIFNVSIEHSQQVAECFQVCGYNARHLASDNESERKEILKWFKETENAILCNVMMVTVGFDEPTIKNIIINFATLSITKFMQCCGRGGRIIDSHFIEKYQIDYDYQLEEKYHFNIIDMGANHVRFGDWSDDRDWEYIFRNPERVYNGVAPMKTCPNCDGLVHAAVRTCTLNTEDGQPCMYHFEYRKVMEQSDVQEMILVTKGINIEELVNKNKKKYQYYTFLELGKDVVENMYRMTSNPSEAVKERYFLGYYELCKSWYNKTLAGIEGNIEDISDSGWHIRRAQNNFNDLCDKKEGKFTAPVMQLVEEEKKPLLLSRVYVPTQEDIDAGYEW